MGAFFRALMEFAKQSLGALSSLARQALKQAWRVAKLFVVAPIAVCVTAVIGMVAIVAQVVVAAQSHMVRTVNGKKSVNNSRFGKSISEGLSFLMGKTWEVAASIVNENVRDIGELYKNKKEMRGVGGSVITSVLKDNKGEGKKSQKTGSTKEGGSNEYKSSILSQGGLKATMPNKKVIEEDGPNVSKGVNVSKGGVETNPTEKEPDNVVNEKIKSEESKRVVSDKETGVSSNKEMTENTLSSRVIDDGGPVNLDNKKGGVNSGYKGGDVKENRPDNAVSPRKSGPLRSPREIAGRP